MLLFERSEKGMGVILSDSLADLIDRQIGGDQETLGFHHTAIADVFSDRASRIFPEVIVKRIFG